MGRERGARERSDHGGHGRIQLAPVLAPERIGDPGGKTSPEELLAAAHGGCLTMSLASELTQAGTPPTRLEVTCRIIMDEVEGRGHQIVGSQLTIGVDAEGADDAAIAAAIERAHAECPFSTLLQNAGATVELSRA